MERNEDRMVLDTGRPRDWCGGVCALKEYAKTGEPGEWWGRAREWEDQAYGVMVGIYPWFTEPTCTFFVSFKLGVNC